MIAMFSIGLAACSNEMEPEMQPDNRVKIKAGISAELVTRVTEDGTAFTDNDAIKVQNLSRSSENLATYVYHEVAGKWSTGDDIYWEGYDDNNFIAWYPVSAVYDEFSVLGDQTGGTADADWMTASKTAKQSDGEVAFSFAHHLSKITVRVAKWGSEFSEEEKILSSVNILSVSDKVEQEGGAVVGDGVSKWVMMSPESLTAIVAPGVYSSGCVIMQLYVNGSSVPLEVRTGSDITIESCKAYVFNVTVGKDAIVDISNVSVIDWEDEVLQDATISDIEKNDTEEGEDSDDDADEDDGINENRYIVYWSEDEMVPSGDSYWNMNPFFKSRVSTINDIEMKFQMGEFTSLVRTAWLFYCERPEKNNGALLNSTGLVLRYNNGAEIVNEKIITWQEMNVGPTDCIVLKISVAEGTVTVNDKVIAVEGLSSFTNIEYLFSSYYYENDDGYAKDYRSIPDGSKLFYVKIGEAYKGFASKAAYQGGAEQNVWESHYGGNVYYEFPRTNFEPFWVYTYSSSWKHFGGGEVN